MGSIVYVKPAEYQLLAFRTVSQFAWRQKPDYQLVLGGDNGLRGYPDRYLTGTRLFLTNLEYRIFSPLKILTVGFGGAAFFDGGYVWRDGQDVRPADLKTDIGVGLRIGLTKSSTARIIRLDIARALNEDNWYISFGTENIFDLGSFQ
jgi:hemolysin activation/secretion protein